jgi:hypothetical protein
MVLLSSSDNVLSWAAEAVACRVEETNCLEMLVPAGKPLCSNRATVETGLDGGE